MQRKIPILLLAALSLISCKKEQKYCDQAMDEMIVQTFTGTIFLCNAQPPEMEFLEASATITTTGSNKITVHLVSTNLMIDTNLNYTTDCNVFESDIPVIFIKDNNGNEKGQYNVNPARISFAFGYEGCLENTSFEGRAN